MKRFTVWLDRVCEPYWLVRSTRRPRRVSTSKPTFDWSRAHNWWYATKSASGRIIGFNWGGWVLGKTAETDATQRVNAALVQAYGPVCIERFKLQPNVEAKWAELTKVDTWRRENYIKESGFATPPGSTSPNAAVADACADALSKIIAMQLPAAK
jgi:hypothetical protein